MKYDSVLKIFGAVGVRHFWLCPISSLRGVCVICGKYLIQSIRHFWKRLMFLEHFLIPLYMNSVQICLKKPNLFLQVSLSCSKFSTLQFVISEFPMFFFTDENDRIWGLLYTDLCHSEKLWPISKTERGHCIENTQS